LKRSNFNNQASKRPCDHPGCGDDGLYQAPRKDGSSRIKDPNSWLWFCMKHVKMYNKKWDYFSNMSHDEVSEAWRNDITWERPSWPMGWIHRQRHNRDNHKSFSKNKQGQGQFDDPFGFFKETYGYGAGAGSGSGSRKPYSGRKFNNEEINALKVMGLQPNFTADDLYTKYRSLAKKFHPDVCKDAMGSEEKIKQINIAYNLLKNKLD